MEKRKPKLSLDAPEVWGKLGRGEDSEEFCGLAIVIPDLSSKVLEGGRKNPFEGMFGAVVPKTLPWLKREDVLACRLVSRRLPRYPGVESHLLAEQAFTGPSSFHQFLRLVEDGHPERNALLGENLWKECTQPSGVLDQTVPFWEGVQKLLKQFEQHVHNSSPAAPNLPLHVLSFLVHLPNQKHPTLEGGYILYAGDPNTSLTKAVQLEAINQFVEAGISSPPQLESLELVISDHNCPPPLLRFLLRWLSPNLCKLTFLGILPDGHHRSYKHLNHILLPHLTDLTICSSRPIYPHFFAPQLSTLNLCLWGWIYFFQRYILPYLKMYPNLQSLNIQTPLSPLGRVFGDALCDILLQPENDSFPSLTSLTISFNSDTHSHMLYHFLLLFPFLESLTIDIRFHQGEKLNFDFDFDVPCQFKFRALLGGEQLYDSDVWERLPKLMTITVTIRIGSSSSTTTHYTRSIHSEQSSWERD